MTPLIWLAMAAIAIVALLMLWADSQSESNEAHIERVLLNWKDENDSTAH